MASDDGVNYRLVKQLVPARQGWQNTDENSTHAIPATTARYFPLLLTPKAVNREVKIWMPQNGNLI